MQSPLMQVLRYNHEWDTPMSPLDNILRGMGHETKHNPACYGADLLRVSPELRRELLLSINEKTGIGYAQLNESGEAYIIGLQIVLEPLFTGSTFRIEGGCQHRSH